MACPQGPGGVVPGVNLEMVWPSTYDAIVVLCAVLCHANLFLFGLWVSMQIDCAAGPLSVMLEDGLTDSSLEMRMIQIFSITDLYPCLALPIMYTVHVLTVSLSACVSFCVCVYVCMYVYVTVCLCVWLFL